MMKKMVPALIMVLVLAAGAAGAAERFEKIFIPNGLAHAEIGDWIMFKMGDGTVQKHSIVEREGDAPKGEIVVYIQNMVNNEPTTGRRIRQPIGEEFVEPPVPEGESHTYERRKETVMFEGAALEITIIDVFNGDKPVRTWYLSSELPVYGVIKKVLANGDSEFEVIDFGFADGEEKKQ